MKKHLLLTGFSCTGKTSIGEKAFGAGLVLDSDIELRQWISDATGENYNHIFEIFISLGRSEALKQITHAEEALIDIWANDSHGMIISLGPGFPLRQNWVNLRRVSYVVLFRRTPENIYESLKKRRASIFKEFPEAKKHDNWDIDVIVDGQRNEFSSEVAIQKIRGHLAQRERYYKNNDEELSTEDRAVTIKRLQALKVFFDEGFKTMS